MTEQSTRIELIRKLWHMLDGRLTEFDLPLAKGERGDHLAASARNWGEAKAIRIDAYVERKGPRRLKVFVVR